MTRPYPKSASKRELVVITLLLLVVQVGVFIFKPVGVSAADGDVDTSFGGDPSVPAGGVARTFFGANSSAKDDIVRAIELQSTGKIVAAGTTLSPFDFALARYNTNGSLDTTFGPPSPTGKVTTDFASTIDQAFDMAIDPGTDKIVVVGSTSSNGNDFAIAQYNADGSLDTTFNMTGKLTVNFVSSSSDQILKVVIQADHKIVVAGQSFQGMNTFFVLARINPNGTFDSTFNGGNVANTSGIVLHNITGLPINQIGDLVQIPAGLPQAGKFMLAGNDLGPDFFLARFNNNGSLDSTFGPTNTGMVSTDFGAGIAVIHSVVIYPLDGKILAGGSTNNDEDFAMARYDSDGVLETASFGTSGSTGKVITDFSVPGTTRTDRGKSVMLMSGGKIVMVGFSQETTPLFNVAIARYNSNGTLDNTFGASGNGKVVTHFGTNPVLADENAVDTQAGILQPDGKILICGQIHTNFNSDNDFLVARFQNTLPPPDLTIAKTHVGNFNQGQVGATYTIAVTNSGVGATSGTVTVTDNVPAGLTATAMNGTNWSCTQPAGPCTRGDALAAGASYQPITLTVDVGASATSPQVNTATVSGGGETNVGNNTANDSTIIQGISLQFSSSTFSAAENVGGGVATITVTRTGSTSSAASVQFATASGSASGGTPPCSAGEDYNDLTGTLNWAAGDSTNKTFDVPICDDPDAEGGETVNLTLSSPTGATLGSPSSAVLTITNDDISSAQVLISEFRLRGPGGAEDEFIEIYNNTDSPITVTASDSSSGFAVAASDGVLRCAIPNGTIIPARGHFLCINSDGYSLSSYPGSNVLSNSDSARRKQLKGQIRNRLDSPITPKSATAVGDATYTTEIPDNTGIALFSSTTTFDASTRLDSVGPTSEANAFYKEGTGIAVLVPSADESAWVRDPCGKGGSFTEGLCPTAGLPLDTNNNASDFIYVDTNGTLGRLGAPGPENLSAPIQRNSLFSFLLLDATVVRSTTPNRVRDFTSDPGNNSTFGTLDVRRRIVNNTGGSVTRLRFRVVDITTLFEPSGIADLRPRSSNLVVVSGINDSNTCFASTGSATTPCIVNVQGTTLETPPTQAIGGGLNSSLSAGTVTLATPLAPGNSINVRFLLGIQQTGTFRFYVNVEALP